MGTLSIVTPADRAKEPHGVTIMMIGKEGMGKTSLAGQLKNGTALLVDADRGTLSIKDLDIDIIRAESWREFCDLVVRLGGVDPAAPVNGLYSAQHLQQAGGFLDEAGKYGTVIFDSLSSISRSCLRWAQQQPEAFSPTGKKDVRGAYGLLAREMVSWIERIQHLRGRDKVLNTVLELHTNDSGFNEWRPQLEGQKTAREALAIVDEVVTYQWIDWGEGPKRAFITSSPNQWGYPGKDRSGKLEPIEEPNLAKLLSKLNGKGIQI
jgi:hypothetical protein